LWGGAPGWARNPLPFLRDSGSGAGILADPVRDSAAWLLTHSGAPPACLRIYGVLADTREVVLFMQILVRENNVDQALRALKKKLQREGVYREMKLRRHYEKPSEKRAREKAAAVRRARKLERKRQERDGAK
jgi:small subunit ribosomal protein S21